MKYFSLAVVLIATTGLLIAQDSVTEPSTGKKFPAAVTVASGDADVPLTLTGVTVRKKFFFKVYGMAHYMQSPPSGSEKTIFAEILKEGKAKHIIMDFARDVGVSQIQDAYRDGFTENARESEKKQIQPLVDQFVSSVKSDVKEGDRYLLTWLADGTVKAKFGNDEARPISDPTFARVLWSIWFGDDSIVDREELIGRLIAQ